MNDSIASLLNDSIVANGYAELEFSDIQKKIKLFKNELINEINNQSANFQKEVESLIKKQSKPKGEDEPKDNKKGAPVEKVFKQRESLLTDLFKISHIRTLRHIFISFIIILCSQFLIYDFTHTGKLNLDFDLFFWLFEGFLTTMLVAWLPMKLTVVFIVYGVFYIYASKRASFKASKKLYDAFFFTLYLGFLVLFIITPLFLINSVSIACRIIILMEQVRLLMKAHAFVRSNIPRVLSCDHKKDSDAPKPVPCPEFSKYLYFLFAPTAVYRDNYPRTQDSIKWKNVIFYLGEVLGCLLYTYCLFDRYYAPVIRSLSIRDMGFKSYVQLASLSIMPGALIQMMVFFSFLHSWHNAWAEVLTFGDRQFYLDWWNSTTFAIYYRTWNTLVQDWLFTYIYKDLYNLVGRKHKMIARLGVIVLSGVFHEHIMSFTFGFFYPVMFIQFVFFGSVVMFIPVKDKHSAIWNIFVWTSLFTGIGIQLSLIGVEWYARESNQCPRIIETNWDYFLPRSLSCQ